VNDSLVYDFRAAPIMAMHILSPPQHHRLSLSIAGNFHFHATDKKIDFPDRQQSSATFELATICHQ